LTFSKAPGSAGGWLLRQLSSTRILRIEQSPSDHEEIRQCGRNLEPMQVLRQTSVAHLLEAEDSLDDAKNMLDLGTHSRLGAVGRFDRLVNAFAPPIALVGEVPGPRRGGTDRSLLPSIGL